MTSGMTSLAPAVMMPGPTIYDAAVDLVRREGKCSLTYIERYLGIGAIVASELLQRMEREGVVSPLRSNGTREVLT